jgi:hypothetical protein
MILHPSILALLIGSVLTSFLLLYAAVYGVKVLRRWDLLSGSEVQLELERGTYLISTMVGYAFGFQLLSLFLFVYTADELCPLFTGAMCAAGTLNVNAYGYPALILKVVNFLLAGTWLIVNHADNRAYDYPLIRKKYLLLLLVTPAIITEAIVQASYFLNLNPDVITSCCGTLFGVDPRETGTGSIMAAITAIPLRAPFFILMAVTIFTGALVYRRAGKGGGLYAGLSALFFILSLAAIISVLSLYFYELPTHHCPFCLLKAEYGYAGYPLYFTLFGGTVTGIGVGALSPFRRIASLADVLPVVQRKLALASIVCYAIFAAIIAEKIFSSSLRLGGFL